MDNTPQSVSRRGILVAAAAGSAIALTVPAAARAAPGVSTPLVLRNRIGTALTRLPGGQAVTSAYSVDLHDLLTEWLRFWFANAPGSWRAPLEVLGEVTAKGRAYLLHGLRYTTADRLTLGFDAATRDPAYWATVASLHRFFPAVRLESGRVRIEDGEPTFGSPEQRAFVQAAQQHVWRGGSAGVASRADWHAFTRDTLRLGLGTDVL